MKKYGVKKMIWIIVGVVAGAGLGYAYHHFVGCHSGACPIVRNPWLSIGYGALIGALFTGSIIK